jgi:serine phosphatase RsbU (regulator of sigma subunit)
MFALVCIAMGINTWLASRSFGGFFRTYSINQARLQAETAAEALDAVVSAWTASVRAVIGSDRKFDDAQVALRIKGGISGQSEIITFQVFQVTGDRVAAASQLFSGSVQRSAKFENKNPASVLKEIEQKSLTALTKRRKSMKRADTLLINLAPDVGLPVMGVVFEIGDDPNLLGMLVTWQSSLASSLPANRLMRAYVVEKSNRVIVSPSSEMQASLKTGIKSALTKAAGKSQVDVASVENYLIGGEFFSGSYAKLRNSSQSFVVVEYRTDFASAVFYQSLAGAPLWVFLAIVLAMVLSFAFARRVKLDLDDISSHLSRLASGDYAAQIGPARPDEIGVLADDVNRVGASINKSVAEQLEVANLEREVQISKFMKATFFPQNDISTSAIYASGFYRPAAVCGGDLWGHFQVSPDIDCIYIGDSAGSGTQAAIIASMIYTGCQSFATHSGLVDSSPSDLLTHLNNILYGTTKGGVCMTFFAVYIDSSRGTFTYSNAGHNFPILIPSDPNDDRSTTKVGRTPEVTTVSLRQGGAPLGIQADPDYQNHQMSLKAGDKFFMFSDGLIECSSPEGTVWGRKILVEQLIDVSKMPAPDIKEEIRRRAFKFYGNKPIADDVTIVALEVKRAAKPFESRPLPPVASNYEATRPRPAVSYEAPPRPPAPPVLLEDMSFNQESSPIPRMEPRYIDLPEPPAVNETSDLEPLFRNAEAEVSEALAGLKMLRNELDPDAEEDRELDEIIEQPSSSISDPRGVELVDAEVEREIELEKAAGEESVPLSEKPKLIGSKKGKFRIKLPGQ